MASYTYKFNKESAQQEKMLGLEQDFTERMWNQTNDWNLAQWNRENEYNTPAAQMERFAMAGINPNNAAAAIAGNDSAAGSVQASPVGSPSAPSVPDPAGTDFSQLLGAGTGLAEQVIGIGKYIDTERDIKQAEYEKAMADVRNLNADTDKKYYEGEELKEKIAGLKFDNVYMKPEQLKNLNAITEKTLADKKVSEANYDKILQEKQNMEKEYEVLDKTIEEADQRIKESKARIAEIKENMKLMISQEQLNAANTELAREQKLLVAAQKDKTDAETRRQNLENDWTEFLHTVGTDPNDHNMVSSLAKFLGVFIKGKIDPDKLVNAVKNKFGQILASGDDKMIKLATALKNGGKKVVQDYIRYSTNNHTNPYYTPLR